MPTASRLDLPRPAIIAIVAVVVLAVTFLVTKAGDTSSTSVSTSVPAASTNTTTTHASSTGSKTGTTATGTTTTPATPKEPFVKAGPGLPRPVARALNANRVVVLFFYVPAASDDQATKAEIRAVRGAGAGVALFQDTVSHISNYRRVVGSLGVSQTPAMIVIDRHRHAELLQGYLDAGTIRQTVRDAF